MALSLFGKIAGPVAVAGILGGVGGYVSLSSRAAAGEAKLQDQGDHIQQVERSLDDVDAKLDRLLEEMGEIRRRLQAPRERVRR